MRLLQKPNVILIRADRWRLRRIAAEVALVENPGLSANHVVLSNPDLQTLILIDVERAVVDRVADAWRLSSKSAARRRDCNEKTRHVQLLVDC